VPLIDVTRTGAAAPAVVTIPTAAFVAARFTRDPVVATREVVPPRDVAVARVVVVRATDAPPDDVRVAEADARPAPPVARFAAAADAAAFVVVRVAPVDVVRDVVVPRDATERAFVVERGEAFVVVRAATAREEFAATPRPVVVAVAAVGTVRPIVVRFVFERVPDVLRDVDTEGFVAVSFTVGVKSDSSSST